MRCIYSSGETCEASPMGYARFNYKPSAEEKEKICNGSEFHACPRFKAYINHLEAVSKGSR